MKISNTVSVSDYPIIGYFSENSKFFLENFQNWLIITFLSIDQKHANVFTQFNRNFSPIEKLLSKAFLNQELIFTFK